MKTQLPIVFAFDENYRMPAWIALKSLLDHADGAEYKIYIMYEKLSSKTMEEINKLAPVNWIKVDVSMFADFPIGYSGLSTYFRLIIQDLLPQYDKIIWSDVDVLFRGSLQEVYNTDISQVYWAGIKAEVNREPLAIHTFFPENRNQYIYMPGFMLINADKMRRDHMTQKFVSVIKEFKQRLKLFDLDVLNLACDKIGEVPFEYCVLENIYDEPDITQAPEYPWLRQTHGHEALVRAKNAPVIIHYAGKWPKIWNRPAKQIPAYYKNYVEICPFRIHFRLVKFSLLWLISKLAPSKEWRRHFRGLRKALPLN